jgi:hypothetical protein
MTRAALLATLLLCACGGGASLPAPEILSISPNRITVPRGTPAAERRSIVISLDAVIAVRVDYGRERVSTEAVRVWIGAEEAPLEGLEADGTLTVTVPGSLDEGTYDVRVSLADGREAVRPSALTVVPVGSQEGGDAGTPMVVRPEDPMRRGDITGFLIESLGEQRRGVPFRVTIRAVGPRAAHFRDDVTLALNRDDDEVSPSRLGPFVGGVCEQLVTVDAHGGNVKLTVTDAFGAQGTSNGFKVRK